MNTDSYIGLIFFAISVLGFGYIAYRYWFDTDAFIAEYKAGILKTPEWYPFRNFYLGVLETGIWKWFARIVATLGFLVSLIAFLYIVILPIFSR